MASLGSLTTSLTDLSSYVKTKLVTEERLERYHAEQVSFITTRVDQAVEPLREEIQVLRSRVEVLETARHRSSSERPRGSDPAFKQIAFKKIASHVSATQRLKEVEAFLRQHFPDLRIKDAFNVRTGPFPKNRAEERKLASVTIVEVSNSDVQRAILSTIAAKGLVCTVGGTTVEIKGAMTAMASARNSALRRAEKVLKEDKAIDASTVKCEFMGSRGVTVAGIYAFTQGTGDSLGEFVKPYERFVLPP